MYNKKLLPSSFLDNSADVLIFRLSERSQLIYLIFCGFIFLAFISIFLIKINVSVKASAQIKPRSDKITLLATTSGTLFSPNLSINMYINVGDTIGIINSTKDLTSLSTYKKRVEELDLFITDIDLILKSGRLRPLTNNYRALYNKFSARYNTLNLNVKYLEKDFSRNKMLYEQRVIALAEFEKQSAEYERAVSELSSFVKEFHAQMESDKVTYVNEIYQLNDKIESLEIQKSESVLISSISGTISKLYGITDESYVHSGQQLFDISPDGELIAECSVLAKDIGYIQKSQPVRIQLDAYNYNQWGVITGNVDEIYNDVIVDEAQSRAYFRVNCNLNSTKLFLKNGYEGDVKKGMSAQVLFIVAKRSLANLLYDKIDNWLNPNANKV